MIINWGGVGPNRAFTQRDTLQIGREGSKQGRGFLRFDLAGLTEPVPPIRRAALRLHFLGAVGSDGDAGRSYTVHRIADANASWSGAAVSDELAQGPAYTRRGAGEDWAGSDGARQAGVDYDTEVLATFSVPPGTADGTWFDIPLSAAGLAHIGSWLGGATNPGLIIIPVETDGSINNRITLASSQYATVGLRPQLIVDYRGTTFEPRAIDTNANGLDDLWEQANGAMGIDPDGDPDGDGESNRREAVAGTDPFSAESRHSLSVTAMDETTATLVCTTVPGKYYQILASADLSAGSFVPVTGLVAADTEQMQLTVPRQSGDKMFYISGVRDGDQDGDGLSDYAEDRLAGFSATTADSFAGAAGATDYDTATTMVQELTSGNVQVQMLSSQASESGGDVAEIRVTRATARPYPLTLAFRATGERSTPQKSAASASDFTTSTSIGGHLTNGARIVLPANTSEASLMIAAVEDTVEEVPEGLRVDFPAISAASFSTRITEGRANPAEAKLLASYLSTPGGSGSNANGVATTVLSGTREMASFDVNFKNLSSVPIGATVSLGTTKFVDNASIPTLRSMELPIAAFGPYATDQAVLDALLSGELDFALFTTGLPGGELEGDFVETMGSTEFQPLPDAPPTPEVLTDFETDREIARFLTQATFGITAETMADMRQRVAAARAAGGTRIDAFAQWIDEQYDLASPSLQAWVFANDRMQESLSTPQRPFQLNALRGWYNTNCRARAQLRSRVAFALSQIFVVSGADRIIGDRAIALAYYQDLMNENAGGNFEDLLGKVSRTTHMGQYLSSLKNRAQFTNNGVTVFPDENYAREVMQLFSIGLFQLHPDGTAVLDQSGMPIPTYEQEDVFQLARVFTGLSFSKRVTSNNDDQYPATIDNTNFFAGLDSNQGLFSAQFQNPMKFFPTYHDYGTKTYLGQTHTPSGSDEAAAEAELDHVMNVLATHQSTAPFISLRLIQRLVTSNPSRGYLGRISQVFSANAGAPDQLERVVKAILLDPEARNLDRAQDSDFGKMREPLIQLANFIRTFDWKSKLMIHDPASPQLPQRLGDATVLNALPFEDESQSFSFALTPEQMSLYEGYDAANNRFLRGQIRASSQENMRSIGVQVLQREFYPPSVFNWWEPGFAQGGPINDRGLVSPEFQALSESTIYGHFNLLVNLVDRDSRGYGATIPDTSGSDFRCIPAFNIDRDNDIFEAIARYISGNIIPPSDAMKPDAPRALARQSHLWRIILDELDTNDDGIISSVDNPTAADDDRTLGLLIDEIDLLLTGGQFKAEDLLTPSGQQSGRDILFERVRDTRRSWVIGGSNPDNVIEAYLRRLRTLIWMVQTSDKGQIQR